MSEVPHAPENEPEPDKLLKPEDFSAMLGGDSSLEKLAEIVNKKIELAKAYEDRAAAMLSDQHKNNRVWTKEQGDLYEGLIQAADLLRQEAEKLRLEDMRVDSDRSRKRTFRHMLGGWASKWLRRRSQ